ncbi:MAG: hypothetical protein K8J08_18875 [Thermoanaerobaculia bacterium]|nr:hypothetical protein [Thermoanaerobaculia bacterium]
MSRLRVLTPAHLFALALAGGVLGWAAPAAAQMDDTDSDSVFRWGIEAKTHYRDSDSQTLLVPFPPGANGLPVPPAERFAMETVDPGSHFEISILSLLLDAEWSDSLVAHAKVDFIDLYERNPTSTDKTVDVDEVWIRFGREMLPATLPEGTSGYVKIGKMGKFERQNDRHLESYGLVSTAFNRLEDTGIEAGLNLGRHFYLKASASQGNPVFMRDPNALAGDNGLDDREASEGLGTGILILYDAEVEDLDVDGDLEFGWGAGLRFGDDQGINGVDFLVWGYQRELAETVDLKGTFYGGDLDLLEGPFGTDFSYPLNGRDKEEFGGNLWVYWGGMSFFAQYVDQDLAGLQRTGIEGELAWAFDLPVGAAIGGQQLFTFIAPAVRYSKLDPDFAAPPLTPSPSFAWDWEKIDYGIRLGIVQGIDFTAEFADNSFVLKNGNTVDNNEFLATLHWRR